MVALGLHFRLQQAALKHGQSLGLVFKQHRNQGIFLRLIELAFLPGFKQIVEVAHACIPRIRAVMQSRRRSRRRDSILREATAVVVRRSAMSSKARPSA